jgi:NADH-quinone oxidoreductase subunit L
VTAGVYMVTRSNAIFLRSPDALLVVAIIGAITAIFAASIGIVQNDIKRVLAYSTISQLGYMFLACGVAAFSAGIFHLMTHAFFKALLFLSAGSVIHGVGGEQDMRAMGGLRKYMPVTFWVMLIATLAIAGIPGLSGFFSKDEILWQSYSSHYGHWSLWLIGWITAFMTSFYMFRLIFMTFAGEYRGPEGLAHVDKAPEPGTVARAEHADHTHQVPIGGAHTLAHAPSTAHDDHGNHGEPHESPWIMLAPLVILAFLSVVGGYVGVGNRFEHFLAPVISHVSTTANAAAPTGETAETTGEPHTTPVSEEGQNAREDKGTEYTLMGLSILAAFGGLALAWVFYVIKPELPDRIAASLGSVYRTVLNKYYIDEFYGATVIKPIVNGSRALLWRGIDVHVIDGTVNDTAEATQDVSNAVRRMQSGNIRSYAGWVAAGAGAVLLYMIWVGVR